MKITQRILDILFPPKCPFCQGLLHRATDQLCPDCQRELPWLVGKEGEKKVSFVKQCVSPLRYQGRVRESIHRFKFSGRRWYAAVFGVFMAQCVADHGLDTVDLICWAPVSKKRRRKRGYDQGELLARETAKKLGRECVPLLKKVRDTPAQSGLKDPSARRANVMGAYQAVDPALVVGKRILLVDDVVTTGETLSECAGTLLMAGAEEVFCVTLAKAG